MALLSLDLQSGLDLQLEIWRNFHQAVCFSPDFSSGEFLLVASFGRCKFHLDCSSVGSLLQSALGGSTADFNVVFISDQVFRFSVSCKDIGLFIYHLNYFKWDSFVVYFHLWNNGGANWQKEFQAFQLEEIDSWQIVQQRKQSYADIVCKLAVTRANAIPLHHQKERRPRIVQLNNAKTAQARRISVFDHLGKPSGNLKNLNFKKFVFDWLDFGTTRAQRDLIPKKIVFDHLNLDLGKALPAKNMGVPDLHVHGGNGSKFESSKFVTRQRNWRWPIYVSVASGLVIYGNFATHQSHAILVNKLGISH
jgi:hypothetical protein